MSIALATKGIIAGFNSGTVISGEGTITEYVEAIREVEIELEALEIITSVRSDTLNITNEGEITVEVEVESGD